MLEFSNDNTLAIHVTKVCNMQCEHCYQQCYTGDIKMEYVDQAVTKIKPHNIALYGGDCLVRPALCWDIIRKYPNKGYIVHTNGTIYNKELLDRVDVIFITLESFIYERNVPYRKYTKPQWETLMQILNDYKSKIQITHNVYPFGNDRLFFKMARLFGVAYSTYPIVMNISEYELDKEIAKYLPLNRVPLTNPKLRILENGMVTRDMRGVHNICHIDEWEDSRRDLLPISPTCEKCQYFGRCPACNIFPHFCKDVLEVNRRPHFCRYTEELWKS